MQVDKSKVTKTMFPQQHGAQRTVIKTYTRQAGAQAKPKDVRDNVTMTECQFKTF